MCFGDREAGAPSAHSIQACEQSCLPLLRCCLLQPTVSSAVPPIALIALLWEQPKADRDQASQVEVLVSPLGRACRGVEAWWLRLFRNDCCCSPVSPRVVTRARGPTTVLLLLSLHYLASTAPLDALASPRVSTYVVACATRSLLLCSRPDRAAVLQLPRRPSLVPWSSAPIQGCDCRSSSAFVLRRASACRSCAWPGASVCSSLLLLRVTNLAI